MATLRAVLAAIVGQVQSVTSLATPAIQANGSNLNILVGAGWPPLSRLQTLGNTQNVAIAVYDRGFAKDNTRWMPSRIQDVLSPTYITTTLSRPTLPPSGTTTITIGLIGGQLAPNPFDAISCVVQKTPNIGGAQTYTAGLTDTTSTIATALALNINTDAVLGPWVVAVAVGSVITLTNRTAAPLGLQSYVGQIDNRFNEVSRINRRVQIITWAGSEAAREATTAPIESLLGGLRAKFGVQVATDSSWIWIKYDGDSNVEDELLKDVYRRDFYIEAEYSVTAAEVAYSVLAPVQSEITF